VQCDNGREFDKSASRAFFLAKGVSLRLSCPYTSQQNGKAERMLRTLNNITRTLLFQASMPPPTGLTPLPPPLICPTVSPLKPLT
jgi:hypothetical protein